MKFKLVNKANHSLNVLSLTLWSTESSERIKRWKKQIISPGRTIFYNHRS